MAFDFVKNWEAQERTTAEILAIWEQADGEGHLTLTQTAEAARLGRGLAELVREYRQFTAQGAEEIANKMISDHDQLNNG